VYEGNRLRKDKTDLLFENSRLRRDNDYITKELESKRLLQNKILIREKGLKKTINELKNQLVMIKVSIDMEEY
jgi:hypothetical protein